MEGKQNYILNNFNFITLCPSLPKNYSNQTGKGATPKAGTAVCAPFMTMARKV